MSSAIESIQRAHLNRERIKDDSDLSFSKRQKMRNEYHYLNTVTGVILPDLPMYDPDTGAIHDANGDLKYGYIKVKIGSNVQREDNDMIPIVITQVDEATGALSTQNVIMKRDVAAQHYPNELKVAESKLAEANKPQVTEEIKDAEPVVEAVEEAPKRKRGRPSKAELAARAEAQANAAAS